VRILIKIIFPLVVALLPACASDSPTPTISVIAPTAPALPRIVQVGSFTLNYPEGWFAQTEPATALLRNEESGLSEGAVSPGQAGMVAIGYTLETAAEMVEGELNPAALVLAFAASMGVEASIGEVAETPLNTMPTARAQVAVSSGDGLIIVVNAGGGYVVFTGMTASDEMYLFEQTFLAIAASVNYGN
jgi:hypothetical protein